MGSGLEGGGGGGGGAKAVAGHCWERLQQLASESWNRGLRAEPRASRMGGAPRKARPHLSQEMGEEIGSPWHWSQVGNGTSLLGMGWAPKGSWDSWCGDCWGEAIGELGGAIRELGGGYRGAGDSAIGELGEARTLR